MNYLNNLKIGTRLVITLGILMAMLMLVGLQGVMKSGDVEARLLDITKRRMAIIEDTNELRLEVNRQARAIRNMALMNNPGQVQAERKAIMDSRQRARSVPASTA